MITIAVTGGIGSGKSTVAAELRDLGAVVIDSDVLAKEVVAPGSAGLAAVAAEFGSGVVAADGSLDRAALAAVVFSDHGARARLEGITHPLVRARFAQLRDAAATDAVVVNDIPLLTTPAAAAAFHLVVGVRADPELRVQRLVARGLTERDARARMDAQLSDDERAALCDVMLLNHGERGELAAAVRRLWTDRLLPFERNTRAGRRAPCGGPALVEPRESWAADARRLAARVSAAADGNRVDHIGSTAIPGLPAKDVIDLQLTVPDLNSAYRLAPRLAAAGFPAAAGFEQDTPHGGNPDPADDAAARWVKRLHGNADPGRSLTLHVRVRDAPNWRWALVFRDWLTTEPTVAAEYLAVKRAAAEVHSVDGSTDGYAIAKEPWLDAAYQRGRAWAARTGWSPGP
ncbi:dephospho-CoA kinase [Nakamurella sp. GG22]